MMREIKFRAWDKKSKKMREVESIGFGALSISKKGYPVANLKGNDIIEQKDICVHRELGEYELMQYIGLKDKNGKEIYEGDIFRFDDEIWSSCYTDCGTEYDSFETHEQYASVEFMYGKFDLINFKYHESQVCADLNENDEMAFYEFATENEVVGNIYENPELLKENE